VKAEEFPPPFLQAAQLSKGVLQVVCGSSNRFGKEFFSNSLCRKVAFTGSTEVPSAHQPVDVGVDLCVEIEEPHGSVRWVAVLLIVQLDTVMVWKAVAS